MKIQCLDAACNAALLIRGVLWWRRVARVPYKAPDGYAAREWQFVPSGDPVPNDFVKQLWSAQAHRNRAREREQAAIKERNWQKPPPKRPYLPSALIVRRALQVDHER